MTKQQAHQIVVTVVEGSEPFDAHCTCNDWTYRTANWIDLGTDWSWHYIVSLDAPNPEALRRNTVRSELRKRGEYGGDCEACGYPVVSGRTQCASCADEDTLQILELSADVHCETCTESYDGIEGDTAAAKRWARTHVETRPGHEVLHDLLTLYQRTRCRGCQGEYLGLTGDTGALKKFISAHESCIQAGASSAPAPAQGASQ